jgi:hypothetical protein
VKAMDFQSASYHPTKCLYPHKITILEKQVHEAAAGVSVVLPVLFLGRNVAVSSCPLTLTFQMRLQKYTSYANDNVKTGVPRRALTPFAREL